MKKRFSLFSLSLLFLLSGCATNGSSNKQVKKIISPDNSTRYAYYIKCVSEGSMIKVTNEDPKLGMLVEHFIFSDGTECYFYLAQGYELVD